MSNLSLANPGTSLNFDGQALQNQQEDEYRKEEEQQQHELRQLITNAFDDLIDDEDILSITSDDGSDSRNVSLVRRASSDSFTPLQEDRIEEQPEPDWTHGFYAVPTSTPMVHGAGQGLDPPQFEIGSPLCQTTEFNPVAFESVRASLESLRGLRQSLDQEGELHHNPSVHGSRDQIDSDYHSNAGGPGGGKESFRGNLYPLDRKAEIPNHQDHHSNRGGVLLAQRQEMMRKSMEDLNKLRMEALSVPQNQQFYHDNGNADSNGHEDVHHQNHEWHAEQPYDHTVPHSNHGNPNHMGQDQGQFHDPGDQFNTNANPHYQNHHPHLEHQHHHFRNIYEGRPYHTIGEREEAEGGNIATGGNQYYHHPQANHMGYYGDGTVQHQQAVPRDNYQGADYSTAYTTQTDRGFYPQSGLIDTHIVPTHSQNVNNDGHQGHQGQQQQHPHTDHSKHQHKEMDIKRNSKDASLKSSESELFSPHQSVEYPDGYKVSYRGDEEEKSHSEVPEKSRKVGNQKMTSKHREDDLDADFMNQDGPGETREVAQLQILYKARGRKIDEMKNELEVTKNETGRENRIQKHQLSVAKGEKEGLTKSLSSCQELLQELKEENAQLIGRLNATQSQFEGVKKGREEMIKKLQTAESTIETLQQHLEEVGGSETLARARHEHDVVISGLQQKYETEIRVLKEKIERQNDVIKDKDIDISKLRQNLAESLKSAENLQVSRGETINRLTQSLEESQKRCRNLLETSSSQDLSQMKIQLQQSLAARTISEEMCDCLQDEIHDLKEQLQMLESASSLGLGSQGQTTHDFHCHNDSLVDLGIKKTLDFETPHSLATSTFNRDNQSAGVSGDVVSGLKAELERCLISNRQKRNQVTELKDELKVVKKDLLTYKQRCEKAELLSQEQQRKIADLESLLSPGDRTNAVENRLKKDITNLKREKQILLEDVEEIKKRLEEVARNEERLTEINRDLNKQIADMVKEYDQDKREALDRAHRTYEQVGETSKDHLRQELTLEFDVERASIISRYEKECNDLRKELSAAQTELLRVKDLYVEVCEEKGNIQTQLNQNWETKLHQVKEDLKKENELNVLRMEETMAKKHDGTLDRVKEEMRKDHNEKMSKLESELKSEKEKEVSTLHEKLEKERANELAKLEQEVERLKSDFEEEKQQEFDRLEQYKEEEKNQELEKVKKEIEEEKQHEFDQLVQEKEKELEKMKEEKEREIKRLLHEKEEEVHRVRENMTESEETLRTQVHHELKKEIEVTMEKTLQDKIAMSKVAWLEEHRATRQIAINNAVKLAEAELRTKMEEELEDLLERQLEEAKILWQGESFKQLEDEKSSWDLLKAEEIASRLAEEHDNWRQTELVNEIETERQNWTKEVEEKLMEDKESWQQVELEAEKLRWMNEWEEKMKSEKEKWVRNELEPTKRKMKQDFEEHLRLEKDNWRCVELETEKLKLMQEMESRINQEKKIWMIKDLPVEVEKERRKWVEEMEGRLKKEKESWMTKDLPQEIKKEKKMWLNELEVRLCRERETVKVKEFPLEMEKEKKKWLKEMEEKLDQEKESWRNQELSAELGRERQNWMKGMEVEMEKRLQARVEEERHNLEKENETNLLEAVEEHQEACKEELHQAILHERENLKQRFDVELQERFSSEKKIWKEMVEQELNQKLDVEREKWKQRSEQIYREMLETEKGVWKRRWENDMQEKVRCETEELKANMLEEFNRQLEEEKEEWKKSNLKNKQEVDSERERINESFEAELKTRLEEELGKLRAELEAQARENLETERRRLTSRHNEELEHRLQTEEKSWTHKFEVELNRKLQAEEEQWKQMIERELDSKLKQERENWIDKLESEKAKLRRALETEKEEEVTRRVRMSEEGLKKEFEDKYSERLETELEQALKEAQDDWQREFSMEMSINTSSAEASQALLKEEFENMKQRSDELQAEMLHREETWALEKQEIISQKDGERRKALAEVQDQNEAEYKKFLTENQDTLNHALKSVRDQHTKEKAELEERLQSELKEQQEREKELKLQLQEINNKQDPSDIILETDKERLSWYGERDNLLQAIADRDALLNKADIHLSKEVEKLRAELQSAYQRRLDAEMSSWKQKIETEYSRMSNAEQKEKLLLEKRLSEVNTELQKVRKQLTDNTTKHAEQIKSLSNEMNEKLQKMSEIEKVQANLRRAKELCQEYQSEIVDNQQKCQKFKSEAEESQIKLSKMITNHEKLYSELQKVREDKASLMERVQSLESSYRKDMALYKQKQEEAALRMAKTEKVLQDMKQRYRAELEKLRKALEMENDTAMESMTEKMVDLQKKHVAAMDALKQKFLAEQDELRKVHGLSNNKESYHQAERDRPTREQPVQVEGEEEVDEEAVQELRSQYLDTVTKIKDDVLRHITETNVRAAETVKTEMVKERTSTFQQIKDFYKDNVRQILQTEIMGSNLETKLMAVEEALETLSSNPSSRSATPRSEDMLDDGQVKSRSRRNSHDLYSRDAGTAPSPRQVSFSGTKDRSQTRTPVNVNNSSSRSHSPRHVRTPVDLEYSSSRSDAGAAEARGQMQDTRKSRPKSSESRKGLSRVMISSRDVHTGRYNSRSSAMENVTFRARSTVPHYSASTEAFSSNLQRPTSVPDLSQEEKELKVWSDSRTADSSYRYTPLRETLRSNSNLQRSNSKSESDLHIAQKLNSEYGMFSEFKAANLDLSTGSISSCDTINSRSHDAGEAPSVTTTPRRHFVRTKLVLKSLQLPDSGNHNGGTSHSHGQDVEMATPDRSEKKNLPLIQFRHGKGQNLSNRSAGGTSASKSPRTDSRKSPTSTRQQNYRPLSVSTSRPTETDVLTDF